MKRTLPKLLLVAVLAAAAISACGPKFAPWHPYQPALQANDSFFNQFFSCVGSAVRSEQMALIVKTFAPQVSEEAFERYRVPPVSDVMMVAETVGKVMASDHSKVEGRFKNTLGVTPSELDGHLSACFALIQDNPGAAENTTEDLRMFTELMQKRFNSSTQRNFDSYNKNYRRYMLTLSFLEMAKAKQGGPDPEAVARFVKPPERSVSLGVGGLGNLAASLRDVNRAAASGDKAGLNSALGKAEKAMDATEADGANLDAMIDTAVALDKGSINEEEAVEAMKKLNKAKERSAAGYESAGEDDGSSVGENVGKAQSGVGGVKADLAAGKQAQCQHLLKDLREAKSKCDAGKQIFCEAFSEKRDEFVKKCGKEMLPKELAE